MKDDTPPLGGIVYRLRNPPERPRPIECPDCGRYLWGRHRCRRRTCPGYAPIWAGDQTQVMFRTLEAYDLAVPKGHRSRVALGMVTAPGSDCLPWDRSSCTHPVGLRCSGDLGCKVQPEAADAFNRDSSRAWSRLHARCAAEVRRSHPKGALRLLARVYEPQARGVNHIHPVLGYSTGPEQAAADHYFRLIAEHAPRYGFGPKSGINPTIIPAARAAAYVTSYLTKKDGRKKSLRDWVTDPHYVIPPRPFYSETRLLHSAGVSMRICRLRRHQWALVNHHGWRRVMLDTGATAAMDPATGELLAEIPAPGLLAHLATVP